MAEKKQRQKVFLMIFLFFLLGMVVLLVVSMLTRGDFSNEDTKADTSKLGILAENYCSSGEFVADFTINGDMAGYELYWNLQNVDYLIEQSRTFTLKAGDQVNNEFIQPGSGSIIIRRAGANPLDISSVILVRTVEMGSCQ